MNEWIEHKGKEMPVPEETLVDVKFRDGRKIFRVKALLFFWKPRALDKFDIVAYRICDRK
jgi:hypothetical protein